MPKVKWLNPSGTTTYFAWRNMRSRALNPKNDSYEHYGMRGITICSQWADDYDQFFADMGECPEGLTLERIDVNGNYEPTNCCWATVKDQLNNQRRNRRITFEGVTKNLSQWAEDRGLGADTLYRRLLRMPVERALTIGNLRVWKHGTRAGYEDHKCKCELCTASNTKRHALRREKKRLALQGNIR